MDRPPCPTAAFPAPSPVPAPQPTSRQLTLPLPPVALLAPNPPAAPPGAASICPGQVWAGLPPTARAQLRRILRQVFQEVVGDECRSR